MKMKKIRTKQFKIFIASCVGIFCFSIILMYYGINGDTFWSKVVMVCAFISLLSSFVLKIGILRLWKKSEFID